MKSDLQRHGLWLLSSGGTTNAKAKRLLMQHKSDDIIRDEGLADTPCGTVWLLRTRTRWPSKFHTWPKRWRPINSSKVKLSTHFGRVWQFSGLTWKSWDMNVLKLAHLQEPETSTSMETLSITCLGPSPQCNFLNFISSCSWSSLCQSFWCGINRLKHWRLTAGWRVVCRLPVFFCRRRQFWREKTCTQINRDITVFVIKGL